MSRRIVLDDASIVERREFFKGLAALAFVPKDGLWVPPTDIATGGVTELQQPGIDEEDVFVDFRLMRYGSSMPVHRLRTRLNGYAMWYSTSPDAEVVFKNGKRLCGYNFSADIR